MSVRHYRVCGLSCASEIELPGILLDEPPAETEVVVRYGEVPESLPNPIDRGPAYEVVPGALLVRIESFGRVLIRDGREILVDPAPGVTEMELRWLLSGSGFGALLHQRGILPLHASAVRVGRGCVAFVGKSGAGKSTLCAYLHKHGYPLVADDILPIEIDPERGVVARTGFTRFKLWAESLELLELDKSRVGPPVRPDMEKYELEGTNQHTGPALPLERIFVLSEAKAHQPDGIEPVHGPQRLELLIDNTYRFRYLTGLERTKQHFAMCAALLRSVPVCRLIRKWDLSRMAQVVDCLEEDFRRLPQTPGASSDLTAAP